MPSSVSQLPPGMEMEDIDDELLSRMIESSDDDEDGSSSEEEKARQSETLQDLLQDCTSEQITRLLETVELEVPVPEGADRSFRCRICLNLARINVECKQCRAMLCHSCKQQYVIRCGDGDMTCPGCRQQNPDFTHNQTVQSLIDAVQVSCSLCDKVIPHGNFYDHVALSCESARREQRQRAALEIRRMNLTLSQLTGVQHGLRTSQRGLPHHEEEQQQQQGDGEGQAVQAQHASVTDNMRAYTQALSGRYSENNRMYRTYRECQRSLLEAEGVHLSPEGLTDDYILRWQAVPGVRQQLHRRDHRGESS